jgi:tRNA(fMet)-specific endonuclease VapC
MKICLDTCAYSKLGLQPPELINCIDEAEMVFISSIVLGEIFAGFSLGKREKENRESLFRFLDLPAVEVVNIDALIADHYGQLVKILRKQGTPIPTNDIWIAATAFETGSRVVTYDSHFAHIPGLLTIAP